MKSNFRMIEKTNSAEIIVDGVIGDWGLTARDFRDGLKEIGDVENIEMVINSPGGSVIDGFAMYDMIKNHPAKVKARIQGWAASMGSILAMAADEIEMPSNTWMMIHLPWTQAIGEASDLRRMAGVLDSMENHALVAYQIHSRLPESEIREMLHAETWMDGTEAVAKGFAEVLTDELEIAASVTGKTKLNAPAEAMAWVKGEVMETEEKAEEVVDGVEDTATEDTSVEPVEVEADTADVEEVEPVVEEEETPEKPEAKDKYDAAYDEGDAVGFARGIKEGETNAIAEIAELQNKVDELTEEVEGLTESSEGLNKSLVAKDASIEDLNARLEKLTGGLKANDANSEAPDTFEKAVHAFGYEKARKDFPELFAANRDYNKNNRREK